MAVLARTSSDSVRCFPPTVVEDRSQGGEANDPYGAYAPWPGMTLTGHTPVSRRATHRLPRWWGKGVEAMLVVRKTSRAFPEKREETMAVATQPQIDVHDNSLAGARAWFAQKGLSRPREGRLLAGVFAGFARRYDINPLVARLLGILVLLVVSPLVYVAAWVLMPTVAGNTPAAESFT